MIIAIEGLSGSNFSCHPFEDSDKSGFQIICNEAIRFTHAYTTSPLSQAGLGSLVTGVAPLVNGLRDNGQTFLQANIKTLPENLYNKKVSTLFIASAPTVKRYSRLHQGFENFHDEYEFNNKTFYRSISESIQIIKNWMTSDIQNKSYFTIVHVADLLFPQVITQTELLEPRPRGIDGQLEEIDENLFSLFSFLKKIKKWESSYIILVGLNGLTNLTRQNELPGTNLYSENVSIPLFIKPPKGREEIPHQWKIDSHVSLQDVGATLFDIYNVENNMKTNFDYLLKGNSLLPSIKGKSDPLLYDKSVLVESSWGSWHFNFPPRYSIRNDQWFVLYDKKPVIYNTVSDRNEFNKVSTKDNSYKSTLARFDDYLSKIKHVPFEKFDTNLIDEILFAQYIIDNEGQVNLNLLNDFLIQIKDKAISESLQFLIIDQLLRHKNWIEIEMLNQTWNNPIINQVLILKGGLNSLSFDSEPCLRLFQAKTDKDTLSDNLKFCDNKNFVLLADYFKIEGDKNDTLTEQILTIIKNYEFQLKIVYFDLSKGGIILGADTSKLKEIITYKLILNLPKFQKEYQFLERKLYNLIK